MSFLQLIQREIINALKLLGLGPSRWYHDEDAEEEEELNQEEETEEMPEQTEAAEQQSEEVPQQPSPQQPQLDEKERQSYQSELLKRLQERFTAKQNAREERQMKLLREKELAERQLNPLKADDTPANSEQLEFNFESENRPQEETPPVKTTSPAALPQPVLTQPYQLPPIDLLLTQNSIVEADVDEMNDAAKKIQNTLDSFFIDADVTGFQRGPRITLYKITVARGVKVEAVAHIANDLAMALSATSLRILAPMPGHDYVGIEVPNRTSDLVRCGASIASDAFRTHKGQIPVVLGRNVEGKDIVIDLARTPHLLVAGATGSGKSVCLNNILISLLYRFPPEDLRLILVDPKIVELSVYNKLPHLVVPVITDVELVVMALRWVIYEMEHRYAMLAKVGVRNLEAFNNRPASPEPIYDDDHNEIPQKLPFIIVIIDEMADIMLTARQDVETCLARIAQLSRAVGIHCIIATQRPSVNVITGVIKANFPTRIAFQVASQIDSRTIIDGKGAESLLGRGDMLYKASDALRMQRLQGAMITDAEIENIVNFCAAQGGAELNFDVIKSVAAKPQPTDGDDGIGDGGFDGQDDGDGQEALIRAAVEIIVNDRKASISYIQRRLKIGYNKAASVIEILEKRNIIGPQIGTAPREILIDSPDDAFPADTL
ncbi:MAG: DNA translocase FtsK [Victivallales bacterium]|nr:DNA translocase FtsK [Victivallales bacterium]